jgi:hypothetical protein
MVQTKSPIRVSRYKIDAIDFLVKVQNVYALQWSGPGSGWLLIPADGSESRKKRDELIYFIVRVSGAFLFS